MTRSLRFQDGWSRHTRLDRCRNSGGQNTFLRHIGSFRPSEDDAECRLHARMRPSEPRTSSEAARLSSVITGSCLTNATGTLKKTSSEALSRTRCCEPRTALLGGDSGQVQRELAFSIRAVLDLAALEEIVQSARPVPPKPIGFDDHMVMSILFTLAVMTVQDIDKCRRSVIAIALE